MNYEEIEKLPEDIKRDLLVFLINGIVVTLGTTDFEIDVKSEMLNYQIQIKLIQN